MLFFLETVPVQKLNWHLGEINIKTILCCLSSAGQSLSLGRNKNAKPDSEAQINYKLKLHKKATKNTRWDKWS